jgi:hypothetical protein
MKAPNRHGAEIAHARICQGDAATSIELINVSKFPDSMLDEPAEIGKDDANLNYEAKTVRISATGLESVSDPGTDAGDKRGGI